MKSSDLEMFKQKLEETFSLLSNCGGFELLRTSANSKYSLDALAIPQGGYNTKYLADESPLGQAVCYIRPIQKDLDLDALQVNIMYNTIVFD